MDSLNRVREAFGSQFGGEPEIIATAPGRVNLIGEHTDYNEGFVFPAAIDRSLYVAARPATGPTELFSVQMGLAKPFDSRTVQKGEQDDWSKYPAGMTWVMRELGAVPNIQAVVHSEVPIGSGVSSSAAIEMAFGVLYQSLANVEIDAKELALLGQRDENEFIGVSSGVMDQMASARGKKGKAMFLDTRSLEIEYAGIPSDLEILLCDTNTPRALTNSAYNERRTQCEEASKILGVKALRDATEPELERQRHRMSDVVFRRARHVITENNRCIRFKDALESNQRDMIGNLMKGSHVSLRDDYEVSSRELDLMAQAAWSAGCVGARMTGAGFGGACVALVAKEDVVSFAKTVNSTYSKSSGIQGDVFVCHTVDGARVLSLD